MSKLVSRTAFGGMLPRTQRQVSRSERVNVAQRGFSLTETLAALLVVTMLTALVASTIPVAFRTFTGVQKKSNALVALTSEVTALRDELSLATDIKTGGSEGALFSYIRANGDPAELHKTDKGWLEVHNKATEQTIALIPKQLTFFKDGFTDYEYTLEPINGEGELITADGDEDVEVINLRFQVKEGDTVLASTSSDGVTYSFRVLSSREP